MEIVDAQGKVIKRLTVTEYKRACELAASVIEAAQEVTRLGGGKTRFVAFIEKEGRWRE